jgi:hypothetical protein
MKKISFSQLESARKNPAAFGKSLSMPSTGTPRFSKYMAWQLAVYKYHKEKNNLSKAISYFESTFLRNFADNPKNSIEREQFIEQLRLYIENDKMKKLTFIENKKRINIPLTNKLRLGGELPLIKMNDKFGYSVYFFCRESATWETELRFPIIQNFVAKNLYNVDLSEVEVGVYSLDFKKHLQSTYSESDVQEAIKELNKIGNIVSLAI